jgi:protein-S-isoprenylcysteine O-methyltransferase Ste14
MKATQFEFRNRSVLNLIQFWIAFQLYSFDHINVVWAFVPWDTPRGAIRARLVFGFGALLLGFAAGIRTWAAAYLRTAVVHDTDLHAEKLVADGPYRHVRNPLYLGTFLMSVGLGFLASRAGFVILVAGAAIRILRLVGREESELAHQQGESYLEFCRRVPSFVPSISARLPAGGQKPEWGQAFRGEAAMWGFFVTMGAFTITLRDSVAWFLGGATLLIWLGRNIAVRMKKSAQA